MSGSSGVKTVNGLFIPDRIEDAAEMLENSVSYDSQEPMDFTEKLSIPLAQWLRDVAEAWLGSEKDWRQLRQTWPVLRVCDTILDDEVSRAEDLPL